MYGDDIRKLLEGVSSDEVRQTHILMDMINSPVQRGVVLAKGSHTPVETSIISELGIYGVFVRLEATDRMIECACVCMCPNSIFCIDCLFPSLFLPGRVMLCL